MIDRADVLDQLRRRLRDNPVVGLLGARQVGKTTLARELARSRGPAAHYFDLEDRRSLRLLDEPTLALDPLRGLVVIDEIQRRPELFPVLRVLADRPRTPARFLVLGGASPALLRQTSESLAGRISYLELGGFRLGEVGVRRWERLWLRGGFPRSFLPRSAQASLLWRRDFIRTFVERDLPSFGLRLPSATMQRFWAMIAHHHGQLWNAAEFARSFGVSEHTVRRYLDSLSSTFVVRQLPPWHENIAKRQVKAPRLYIRDPGLLHALLDVEDRSGLARHPRLGASWEGFALECVIQHVGADPEHCFFWRTHTGAELDLLIVRGQRRRGFEFKYTDAPRLTPSMRSALADLKLDSLDVVHAGADTFMLSREVRAVALRRLLEDVRPL